MTRRLITAGLLLACVFLGFYFDSPLLRVGLLGILAMLTIFCIWEITDLMKRKGLRVFRRVAAIGSLAMLVEAALTGQENTMLVFGSAVCLAWLVRMPGEVSGALADISATCFTLAYVGIPMAALTRIFLSGSMGEAWLIMTMGIVWMTDSCALFAGRSFGKHKLWPKISPGKTWEGSIGGTLGAVTLAVGLRLAFPKFYAVDLGWLPFIIYAVVFSALGQLGDLAESLLKRDVGVKDSGSPLTGHGGWLDLMDAVLFTALPLLVFLRIFVPQATAFEGFPFK